MPARLADRPAMKVLVLATDIFTRGGIARYTSTLASSLGNLLGPENVDVLCFFDWGHAGEVPKEFRFLGEVSSRMVSAIPNSFSRFLTNTSQWGSFLVSRLSKEGM